MVQNVIDDREKTEVTAVSALFGVPLRPKDVILCVQRLRIGRKSSCRSVMFYCLILNLS